MQKPEWTTEEHLTGVRALSPLPSRFCLISSLFYFVSPSPSLHFVKAGERNQSRREKSAREHGEKRGDERDPKERETAETRQGYCGVSLTLSSTSSSLLPPLFS
eukprot:TRINITY_DN20960_c0_g1_i1.p1 TRINITY_DN20960_c0_g1~~TRINITY_DN20960_c0_g1_i1.p1  ORF type:complete len:117 (-),score=21.40 TRINITY_DN20960_c0_g1_i1:165-476(-)